VREPAVRAYFEVIGLVGEGIVLDLNRTGLEKRMAEGEACKNCGRPIKKIKNNRKFCCDECRFIWWNEKRR
jgi:protein-arginine kinase activator protein McsA